MDAQTINDWLRNEILEYPALSYNDMIKQCRKCRFTFIRPYCPLLDLVNNFCFSCMKHVDEPLMPFCWGNHGVDQVNKPTPIERKEFTDTVSTVFCNACVATGQYNAWLINGAISTTYASTSDTQPAMIPTRYNECSPDRVLPSTDASTSDAPLVTTPYNEYLINETLTTTYTSTSDAITPIPSQPDTGDSEASKPDNDIMLRYHTALTPLWEASDELPEENRDLVWRWLCYFAGTNEMRPKVCINCRLFLGQSRVNPLCRSCKNEEFLLIWPHFQALEVFQKFQGEDKVVRSMSGKEPEGEGEVLYDRSPLLFGGSSGWLGWISSGYDKFALFDINWDLKRASR
ncbi:hypothetical protein EV127DRAFT_406819 [Xylaria flabelliformis]|nr:hypothetical protein EV127DRAFT_406819 [Xylaria flabelliformis]